jgi:hypothetical protein
MMTAQILIPACHVSFKLGVQTLSDNESGLGVAGADDSVQNI